MQYVVILQKQSLIFEMTIVKYLCQSLFLNNPAGVRLETLLKWYTGTGASC